MNNLEVTRKIIITLLVIILVVAPALLFIDYQNKITAKIIEEQEKYYDWLVDNCQCIEKDRVFCREGFELTESGKMCKTEGKYTGVLLGCSQFNCEDEIVNWNKEKDLWEPKLDVGGQE